jgi:hypothetical protein
MSTKPENLNKTIKSQQNQNISTKPENLNKTGKSEQNQKI